MMRRIRTCFATAFGLIAAVATAHGGEPMKGGVAYRLTIDSEMRVSSARTDAVTNRTLQMIDYRLARRGDRIEMAIDRFTNSTTQNGQEVFHAEMGRSRLVRQERGQDKIIDRAGATPEMAATFDQYEAPVAVLTLDAEGGEVGRDLTGDRFMAGLVDLARSFHPRFPKDRAEWDAKPLIVTVGQKRQGMLHHVKRDATQPGRNIDVDVSGKIDVSGQLGTGDIKKGHYEVKGLQTYDPALGDWVAGKLTISQDIEATTTGGDVQILKGEAVWTLTRLDGPDGAKASP